MAAIIASQSPRERASARPLLSVVMPCYNEAQNLDAAIGDVVDQVLSHVPHAEMIVVDDGSRDASGEIARAWAARDTRIRVISQANAGHGPALVCGIRAARGDYCLLLDSDRQVGLAGFRRTWELAPAHDAVLGVRRNRADPRHRLLLSRALRTAMRLGLGVRAADANAPYKLVRRPALLKAVAAMPERPMIPSILLTVHLKRSGARVVEQPVAHFARTAGETTLRLRPLLRFCRRSLRELVRFHRALGRAR